MSYDIVEPRPDSLIESLRSFGYTPETSVADLVDNSITAQAKNIWISFHWDGWGSTISIVDDGRGMNADELRNAMRAGSAHPLAERSAEDLGRFGLGLKTASFSQCRNLTVGSRRAGGRIGIRRWDLDYVNETREWRLLHEPTAAAAGEIGRLAEIDSGTVVVWEQMDRIVDRDAVAGSRAAQAQFLDRVARIEDHLAMVFHDYLSGRGQVRIHVNGRRLLPWDPFLSAHSATQILAEESLQIFDDQITVVPYVLPHKSRLAESEHAAAAGSKGWNAQQGFYIYRNRRLLVSGSWLNFFRQEEHYKLARIRVDIPNSMDSEWDIDVRKARARPPDSIRADLRKIARITRERASEVYRFRGEVTHRRPGPSHGRVWISARQKGSVAYRINRTHPLVERLLKTGDRSPTVEAMLRLIEETVPVQQIWIDAAETPDGHAAPFATAAASDIQEVLGATFEALLDHGYTIPEAIERLLFMHPFDRYPDLVRALNRTSEVC